MIKHYKTIKHSCETFSFCKFSPFVDQKKSNVIHKKENVPKLLDIEENVS
jgi:hypothetical protein